MSTAKTQNRFILLAVLGVGRISDCNSNGIPDSSETDCDSNGIPDDCDIDAGADDCNANSVPDVCDPDCNGNDVPDECEVGSDCNTNGVLDTCEFAGNECGDPIMVGEPICASTDVNCDGATNALDLANVQSPTNWALPVFAADSGRTDINGDCMVNALDIALVQSPLAWANSTGPCHCCKP